MAPIIANFKGPTMTRKIMIVLGFLSFLGFTSGAHADHGPRGYVTKHYHSGYGHPVKHRYRGHHRQIRHRARHHRANHYYQPRVRRHYYYDGYRPYRHRHHRVDPLVAGLVVGTLVYTLSGH